MEEKKTAQSHKIILTNRQSGVVSGVLDVISFDEKLIVLSTQCGKLTIKGDRLHVNQLNLEKGDVDISGEVDTLVYSEDGKKSENRKESVLGRLFK